MSRKIVRKIRTLFTCWSRKKRRVVGGEERGRRITDCNNEKAIFYAFRNYCFYFLNFIYSVLTVWVLRSININSLQLRWTCLHRNNPDKSHQCWPEPSSDTRRGDVARKGPFCLHFSTCLFFLIDISDT